MDKKTLSYAKAYEKLESIVRRIESDQLDVDELSENLKEAAELLRFCKEKLFVVNEETKKILEGLK